MAVTRIFFLLCLLSLLPSPLCQEKACHIGPPDLNAFRVVSAEGLSAGTTGLFSGPLSIGVSDAGFRIWIKGRKKALAREDFRLVGKRFQDGKMTMTFKGKGEFEPLVAKLDFSFLQGIPVFSKTISLSWEGKGRSPVVAALDVERLKFERDGKTIETKGGKEERNCKKGHPSILTGQPVYAGKHIFMALDHPAGFNLRSDGGWIILRHHPNKALPFKSFPALLGFSAKGQSKRLFWKLIDSVRRKKPSPFPHYNSWYDMRSDMTEEKVVAVAKAFLDRGIPLAAVVPDDYWQDPRSIWKADAKRFPQGLLGLSKKLQKLGTRLGLWMPLTGYKLDVKWGVEKGYEKGNGNYYRIQGPNYKKALKERIRHFIEDCRMKYFKMDFNFQLNEAKTPADMEDATCQTMSLLDYMASLDPDVVLNVTSFVYTSPFWLKACDFCWVGGWDFSWDKNIPAIRMRDRALTYRDGIIFRNIVERSPDFPLNSLMLHGITRGRYCYPAGKDETVDSFLDACIMHVARGCFLQELYITPGDESIKSSAWDALRETLLWAGREQKLLANTSSFLGDASKGEVTGYRSPLGERAFATLRNPTLATQNIKVPVDSIYALHGKCPKEASLAIIYPRRKKLGPVKKGESFALSLGCHETIVIGLWPKGNEPASIQDWPWEEPLPSPVDVLNQTFNSEKELRIRVKTPAKGKSTIVVAQMSRGKRLAKPTLHVGSELVELNTVPGASEWRTGTASLPRGKTFDISIKTHPHPMGAKGELRVYLLASREDNGIEPSILPGKGSLPPVINPCIRTTGILASSVEIKSPGPLKEWPKGMARNADNVKSLFLCIDIFGSNQGIKKAIRVQGKWETPLPANMGKLDAWESAFVPLPKDFLNTALSKGLSIKVKNLGGDYLKIRKPRLVLKLKNGKILAGPPAKGVWTSVKPWLYFEGEPFKANETPSLLLKLP